MKFFILLASLISLHAQQPLESQEDILYVTARKKREKVSDVPQSVTRVNSDEIDNMGATSLRELTPFLSNVDIIGSKSGRYVTPYIRGQGNQDLNLPEDISVGIYLDGVPMPRYAIDNELLDLQSVEVLRGPQGTLFGRNSQAGAINLITKDPMKSQGHSLTLKGGNLGLKEFRGTTTFSGKKWANRLAIKVFEEDGFIEDKVLNTKLGDEQSQSFFNSLSYTPTDYSELQLKIGAIQRKGTDPLIIDRHHPEYPVSGQGFEPQFDTDMVTTSLQYRIDRGSSEFKFTSSFNYYDFDIKYDESDYFITYDYLVSISNTTVADLYINDPTKFTRSIKEYQRQLFNEALFSKRFSSFDLTVGANFSVSDYRLLSDVNTFSGGAFVDRRQDVRLETKNYALFTDGSFQFNEKLSLSLGLRFNSDHKNFNSLHNSTSLSFYKQESDESFQDLSGRVALNYKRSEDHQLYFNFARGYQSGGYPSFHFNNYNGIAQDQPAYDESYSHNFEIGQRLWLLDKKLFISNALFYNDIRNKQVRLKDPTNNLSFYANIDTLIVGGETSLQYKLNSDLNVGIQAGYTKAVYKEETRNGNTLISERGARAANIPYWSGAAFVHYEPYWSRFNLSPFIRAQYRYKGKRFGETLNQTVMGSYGLFDLRAGVINERFKVTLYGDNLFDKTYETQAYYYSGLQRYVSTPGMPQRYGAEVTLFF